MATNDPTGKTHATVTKTTSQQARKGTYASNESTSAGGASIELMTPKNILGGLSGVARASNKSDSTSVGAGNSQGLKLPMGMNSDSYCKPSNMSNSTNVGR